MVNVSFKNNRVLPVLTAETDSTTTPTGWVGEKGCLITTKEMCFAAAHKISAAAVAFSGTSYPYDNSPEQVFNNRATGCIIRVDLGNAETDYGRVQWFGPN